MPSKCWLFIRNQWKIVHQNGYYTYWTRCRLQKSSFLLLKTLMERCVDSGKWSPPLYFCRFYNFSSMISIWKNEWKYISHFLYYYISINNKLPASGSTFWKSTFWTEEETSKSLNTLNPKWQIWQVLYGNF